MPLFRMTSIIPFQQLAHLCVAAGCRNAIISPGSRNAILTIAFTSNASLKCYSISDERSAAYIALGMALESKTPTILICTSGTAALNYFPAVAEAFFQEVPLLVLTADRPKEWIHQYDGQTVFQKNVFGKHVLKSFEWPENQNKTEAESISNEALNLLLNPFTGPVHINLPIAEPFYPSQIPNLREFWEFNRTENKIRPVFKLPTSHTKKLLVVGQQDSSELAEKALEFSKRYGYVLVADGISNVPGAIHFQDIFLKKENNKHLIPEFLLTVGMSIISKPLKLFLRENKIKEHWHVQDNPFWIDPFRSITKKIEMDPLVFFDELLNKDGITKNDSKDFVKFWELENSQISQGLTRKLKQTYSEIFALHSLLANLTKNVRLHVGNSMPVRYLNILHGLLPKSHKIYCNRGTSGIDGSLSTALGQALTTEKDIVAIVGDVSAHYDKNAFWNTYLPKNFKVIILNNGGGVIFGMIDGPRKQESFERFFKTKQPFSFEKIAEGFGLKYMAIKQNFDMDSAAAFLNQPGPLIVEIFSDYDENIRHYKLLLS